MLNSRSVYQGGADAEGDKWRLAYRPEELKAPRHQKKKGKGEYSVDSRILGYDGPRLKAKHPPIEDRERAAVAREFASLMQQQGRLDKAEEFLGTALKTVHDHAGARDKDTLKMTSGLGSIMKREGKTSEAEKLLREALEGERATLGHRHPSTLITVRNLGNLLHAKGELEEAEPLLREALDAQVYEHGDMHPDTLVLQNSLGLLLQKKGKTEEAHTLLRAAADGAVVSLGKNNRKTLAYQSDAPPPRKKPEEKLPPWRINRPPSPLLAPPPQAKKGGKSPKKGRPGSPGKKKSPKKPPSNRTPRPISYRGAIVPHEVTGPPVPLNERPPFVTCPALALDDDASIAKDQRREQVEDDSDRFRKIATQKDLLDQIKAEKERFGISLAKNDKPTATFA